MRSASALEVRDSLVAGLRAPPDLVLDALVGSAQPLNWLTDGFEFIVADHGCHLDGKLSDCESTHGRSASSYGNAGAMTRFSNEPLELAEQMMGRCLCDPYLCV